MAMEAISWTDVESYFRLIGVKPMRWELRAITELDAAFIASRFSQKTGVVKGAKALRRMTGAANG